MFRNGDVFVGSLPTTNGKAQTATAGAIYVISSAGKVIETIEGGDINGPWDMTAYDGGNSGDLFVTNVLNGTVAAHGKDVAKGTVVRVGLNFSVSPPRVSREVVIANGFEEATNTAALVLGPTGLALAPNGTLYLADTVANRVRGHPQRSFACHLRWLWAFRLDRSVPKGTPRPRPRSQRGHPHGQRQRRRDHRDDTAGPTSQLDFP